MTGMRRSVGATRSAAIGRSENDAKLAAEIALFDDVGNHQRTDEGAANRTAFIFGLERLVMRGGCLEQR